MSEALVKKPNEQIQLNILSMIHSGEIETAEDIAYHFPSIGIEEAVALLNDEEFYLRICNHTSARVKLLYHGKGVEALDKALTHGSHSEAMAAYDRVAKAAGAEGSKKEKRPMNFAFFTLEEVLDREKVVKAKVSKPAEEEEEKETKFKPGLNYIPRSKVNGNIFENGEDEEEPETIYIEQEEEEYEEEEWEEED